MNRRRTPARRDWKRLVLYRIIPAVIVAVAGTFALRDTTARVVMKGNAEIAHTLAPWDGVVTARLALDTMQAAGMEKSKRSPEDLARAALRQDPTAVEALNVLAAQAQLRGDTQRTRDLFGYSLTLSRRELISRLWAIEEAVSRGDIRGALKNYDFALKISNYAPTILYPILAAALSEPRVRTELIPIMLARPNWGPEFTDYLSRAAVNPKGTAAFYPMLQKAGLPVSALQNGRAVDTLSAQGFDQDAWDYYTYLHPKADRRRSRDADFSSSSDNPTVFDWLPLNEGGLSASIVGSSSNDGALVYSIAPASSGKLIQQRQLLPPGRYILSGNAQGVAGQDRERPYFSVVCDDGRELVQAPLPQKGQNAFRATFAVSSDCPTQYLTLIARQTDSQNGVQGTVGSALISPAQ